MTAFEGKNFNPAIFLEKGEYFSNSRVGTGKQAGYYINNYGYCGLYRDEIVPIKGASVWFYHGNPIAMYKPGEGYTLGNCGYKTVTTKERLNTLPGVYISQRKFKWYNHGSEFINRSGEILAHIGKSIYQKIDGWRGYNQPIFAIVGASDTGMWSDSPANSKTVFYELQEIKAIFSKRGIRLYEASTVTSNVFCMKRWLCAKGKDIEKALDILEGMDIITDFRHVYKAN
jgi:hypothetical protein